MATLTQLRRISAQARADRPERQRGAHKAALHAGQRREHQAPARREAAQRSQHEVAQPGKYRETRLKKRGQTPRGALVVTHVRETRLTETGESVAQVARRRNTAGEHASIL